MDTVELPPRSHWRKGSKFEPLTVDEAKDWIGRYNAFVKWWNDAELDSKRPLPAVTAYPAGDIHTVADFSMPSSSLTLIDTKTEGRHIVLKFDRKWQVFEVYGTVLSPSTRQSVSFDRLEWGGVRLNR